MKNAGYFIGGLLAGAAIGAALALLYAPQKGEDTRRQIKEKIQELEGELVKMREKLKEKGGELKDDIKRKIQEIEARIEQLVKEYKNPNQAKTADSRQ